MPYMKTTRLLQGHTSFSMNIFTFGCCILLRIYPTGSLWRRQLQQSFNTLTPLYFPSHSLHVSAPTGHLQVRYTIRYFNGLKYKKPPLPTARSPRRWWTSRPQNLEDRTDHHEDILTFQHFYIWDRFFTENLLILQFLYLHSTDNMY
jgi:hypothetical protein